MNTRFVAALLVPALTVAGLTVPTISADAQIIVPGTSSIDPGVSHYEWTGTAAWVATDGEQEILADGTIKTSNNYFTVTPVDNAYLGATFVQDGQTGGLLNAKATASLTYVMTAQRNLTDASIVIALPKDFTITGSDGDFAAAGDGTFTLDQLAAGDKATLTVDVAYTGPDIATDTEAEFPIDVQAQATIVNDIYGTVYGDLNQNGLLDATETALKATVKLDKETISVTGPWAVYDMKAGTYPVSFSLNESGFWIPITIPTQAVVSSTPTRVDAGYYPLRPAYQKLLVNQALPLELQTRVLDAPVDPKMDIPNGTTFAPGTDFPTWAHVNPTTGEITVDEGAPLGTYEVLVTATHPDYGTVDIPATITVVNNKPIADIVEVPGDGTGSTTVVPGGTIVIALPRTVAYEDIVWPDGWNAKQGDDGMITITLPADQTIGTVPIGTTKDPNSDSTVFTVNVIADKTDPAAGSSGEGIGTCLANPDASNPLIWIGVLTALGLLSLIPSLPSVQNLVSALGAPINLGWKSNNANNNTGTNGVVGVNNNNNNAANAEIAAWAGNVGNAFGGVLNDQTIAQVLGGLGVLGALGWLIGYLVQCAPDAEAYLNNPDNTSSDQPATAEATGNEAETEK